jgi:hypothetical protein
MQSKSKHQLKNQLTHSDYQQVQLKATQQLQSKVTPHLFVLPGLNRLISVLNLVIPKL